ncbi:MAG: DUF349 domain-containing protein [Alistipes sp.]|nr:DUF349 domain-containing protein [Alistipes sp.]
MTAIKTTEASVQEVVSNAEDALKVNLEQVECQDAVTPEAESAEEELQCDDVAAEADDAEAQDAVIRSKLAGKSKAELLDYLVELVSENQVQNIRHEVEAVKVAFYKLHRADMDLLYKQIEEGADVELEQNPDEARFKELYKIYRDKRDEYVADVERQKEENYKAKLEIIKELKSLVSGEETLNNTFVRFRELQSRWKAAGQVPQKYVNDVWETYNLHVENFYDFVHINKELRDLDWKKNLEAKSALCEQAERLATEPQVVEAFHKLQKLHEEWRDIGPVAGDQKEALWARFKAASSVVNRRHQEYFEGLKSVQMDNYERKSAICEEIEKMGDASLTSHKAWNKASERLLELQKEWRTIGFAPKRENTKVYERFRAACDKFFEQKRAFYSEVKEGMDANLRLKEALCEAAEALQESEEWKEATDKLLALQAEWKTVGAVSRRYADVVWKRFRAACDKFFERKAEHFASKESQYEENLRRKNELLAEMAEADIKAGGYDMIKEFQRRWSEVGFVPIKHKNELQKRYKEAVDRLFGVVRGADRENALNRFKERVTSLKAGGDKRLRSEREKLYNRVRQLEQEVSTLENNIGFFSRSKGAESIIAEVEEKIAKAKREIADTIAKVKLIDGE